MRNKYLNILELHHGASIDEIKLAYKKQALKYHPDKNPNDWLAEEAFKKVQDAYNYLTSNTENEESSDESSDEDPMQILAEGTPDEISDAIRRGVIDVKDPKTMLIASTNTDDPEVIKLLCELGADVNCENTKGVSPLQLAAELNSNPAIIETLIELGADVNHESENESTPLIATFGCVNDSTERKLEILLEAGANPNVISKILLRNSDAPVHLLEIIVESNTSIRRHTDDEYTALEIAITQHCPIETIKFLLENGSKPNQKIKSEKEFDISILLQTIIGDEPIEYVKVLIDYGADVNYRINESITPLVVAVEKSNIELVRLLITSGAIVDNHVLRMANRGENEAIIYLIKKAPNKNLFGPNTTLSDGVVNKTLVKSNMFWDKIHFWSRNRAKSDRAQRSKLLNSDKSQKQNAALYLLSQLNGVGTFLFIPIALLAFAPTIIAIENGYKIPALAHILIGSALAFVIYWYIRGIALFALPLTIALLVATTPNDVDGTVSVKERQKEITQAKKDFKNEEKIESNKAQDKEIVAKENVSVNPLVGDWNPVIENYEEYEPYMLRIEANGNYTIVAEVEENNILGKWQDLKDGTFKFADEMSFISGIGKVVDKDGTRELVIANESGKISKFTIQN